MPKAARKPTPTKRPPNGPFKRRKYLNIPVFQTPAGEFVGRDHAGPKTQVADSQKEFRRMMVLINLEDQGVIQNLQCALRRGKRRFRLHAQGGVQICSYTPDYVYVRAGRLVAEDCKGKRTAKLYTYRLKKLWMLVEYKIQVIESPDE